MQAASEYRVLTSHAALPNRWRVSCRVIGDLGGRGGGGLPMGAVARGRWGNVQCLGMMFGKMWVLVKFGRWV